jgi:hypothetical protein
MFGVNDGIATDLYVNLDRSSLIWDEIAALKDVVSSSGLPGVEAGVRVPVVSCDWVVLPLENTVDCDSLMMLD